MTDPKPTQRKISYLDGLSPDMPLATRARYYRNMAKVAAARGCGVLSREYSVRADALEAEAQGAPVPDAGLRAPGRWRRA